MFALTTQQEVQVCTLHHHQSTFKGNPDLTLFIPPKPEGSPKKTDVTSCRRSFLFIPFELQMPHVMEKGLTPWEAHLLLIYLWLVHQLLDEIAQPLTDALTRVAGTHIQTVINTVACAISHMGPDHSSGGKLVDLPPLCTWSRKYCIKTSLDCSQSPAKKVWKQLGSLPL